MSMYAGAALGEHSGLCPGVFFLLFQLLYDRIPVYGGEGLCHTLLHAQGEFVFQEPGGLLHALGQLGQVPCGDFQAQDGHGGKGEIQAQQGRGQVCYAAFRRRQFVNRGFVSSPLCPIYGVGAVLFAVFLPELTAEPFFLFLSLSVRQGKFVPFFCEYCHIVSHAGENEQES